MGILANTVSICQFRVAGDLPAEIFDWAGEQLRRLAFRPIDTTPVELSIGWVHVDDQQQSDFTAPAHFWRDHYLVFTLRCDQRRLPASLVKAYQQVAEHEYLAANPGLSRVPKQKREELKDAVRAALLGKTLPVPATFDAVWDTRTGILTFVSLSAKNMEMFETLFKKTFEGFRLIAIHPYARAGQVADETLTPLLAKANQATSDSVLDLIRANQWLGWDFLYWLMYRTMHDAATYRINQPGHAELNDPFTAYLNDRLVLMSTGEQGMQKITVAGPQDHFCEVKNALQNNKRITESTIYLEKDEHTWRLTLKGELFHFGSFRAPSVKIEKDAATDQASEREAVFYERMYLLEQGLQIFDSLLATFLYERLGGQWQTRDDEIRQWLAAP